MAAPHPSAGGSLSPASSPRLLSPPPFPEVQIGPKSPASGTAAGDGSQDVEEKARMDKNASRRVRPGTKSEDWPFGPPLIPLSEIDSSFQLQEHLKALYHHHTKHDQRRARIPLTRETALILATPPENVDRSLWLYELCRLSVIETNILIVAFFNDAPSCSAQTCPEMRASEWQYLCAVHDPPKSCCAIDYCCHTLDWAGNVLTSPKHFPSRLTLGNDAAGGPQQGIRQLTNIFRRLYRMFAHAWFQHREVFWKVEGRKGLYIFFKTICDYYSLIPEDNYTIPPEAEGLASSDEDEPTTFSSQNPKPDPAITSKQDSNSVHDSKNANILLNSSTDMPTNTTISTGATTRRHKHTPSTGSFVTTIHEGEEDDEPAHTSSVSVLTSNLPEQAQSPTRSPKKHHTRASSIDAEPLGGEETHRPATQARSSVIALAPAPPPLASASADTEQHGDTSLSHEAEKLNVNDDSLNGDDGDMDNRAEETDGKNIEEKDKTTAPATPRTTIKEGDDAIPAAEKDTTTSATASTIPTT